MMNFGYLENNDSFVALYTACREAEEFALMKPDISAMSARKAMEWVVRYIYSEIDANPPYGYTVFDICSAIRRATANTRFRRMALRS